MSRGLRRLQLGAVATRKGDDGTTGLLFGGDAVRKDDLRTEAYGTIDEAVAALGLARAAARRQGRARDAAAGRSATWPSLILRLQRELFVGRAPSWRRTPTRGTGSRTAGRASPREMVDGDSRALLRDAEAHDRDAARVRRPGRDGRRARRSSWLERSSVGPSAGRLASGTRRG